MVNKQQMFEMLQNDIIGRSIASSICSQLFEWPKWCESLPTLQFPSHWHVQILPPFASAIVRFRVYNNDKSNYVSVYFDGYGELGCFGKDCKQPYWEAYPIKQDIERFAMEDTADLISAIDKELFGKDTPCNKDCHHI